MAAAPSCNTLPLLEYEFVEHGGYGTKTGGKPFSLTEVDDYETLVRGKCHITRIQAWAGNDLNKLMLTYAIGTRSIKKEYGKEGGSLGNEFNIAPGNYIVVFKCGSTAATRR